MLAQVFCQKWNQLWGCSCWGKIVKKSITATRVNLYIDSWHSCCYFKNDVFFRMFLTRLLLEDLSVNPWWARNRHRRRKAGKNLFYYKRVGKWNPYSEANKIPKVWFGDINAQQSTGAPPLGPILGARGIPLTKFNEDFNKQTAHVKWRDFIKLPVLRSTRKFLSIMIIF